MPVLRDEPILMHVPIGYRTFLLAGGYLLALAGFRPAFGAAFLAGAFAAFFGFFAAFLAAFPGAFVAAFLADSSLMAAWAAARRAMGTRYGEQLT